MTMTQNGYTPERMARSLVKQHGPCRAYHVGFEQYMRCRTEEAIERWKDILTRIKETFPPEGCSV